MSRYFTINIEKEDIGCFANEVRLLLKAYEKNDNTAIYPKKFLDEFQEMIEDEHKALSEYGIIRTLIGEENKKLKSTAIQLAGKIVLKHMSSQFGHLRPEFYVYDEICDCGFSFVDEKINTRIKQAKLLVDSVLTDSISYVSIVSELLSDSKEDRKKNGYKLNNLALVWLGNVSEDSWKPEEERERARAFLKIYTHQFFEKYEYILLGYKKLIEKISQNTNDDFCFAALLTGCEHLSEYVDVNAHGVMLTRRMLEQLPSEIIEDKEGRNVNMFINEKDKKIVENCLSNQLKKDVKQFKEIIFLDVASKNKTIQKYLLPLFDEWGVNVKFIFLRYTVTEYDEYNSLGFGDKNDSVVIKVANILDDGFPTETTSPIGIDAEKYNPTGFSETNRKWFHTIVKDQVEIARKKT